MNRTRADAAGERNYDCTRPVLLDRTLIVGFFRCWDRRRCPTCALLMSWDDTEWIRRGVEYWLGLGVSLVFVTLTLAEPRPYAEVAEMWRVFKQALDRKVSKRPGYLGGIPFVRVFERQEKRFLRTGETAVHLHALIGGLQYRGDRLSGRPGRRDHRKAEELGLDGAPVQKQELIDLAMRYGFGKIVDITQIQATAETPGASYDVADYLAKYLGKFENLAEWLPKGKQVIAGSLGGHYWAGPGVTRQSTRQDRLQKARRHKETLRAAVTPPPPPEPPAVDPEQLELPIPWPPPLPRRR